MATKHSWRNFISQIEEKLDEYLRRKAPALPESVKDVVVKVLPILIVIGVVLWLPSALSLVGISTVFAPFAPYALGGLNFAFLISSVLTIIIVIFQILALPGLFNKQRKGWNMLLYANLTSVVSSIFNPNLLLSIIVNFIALYILFQVKERYR